MSLVFVVGKNRCPYPAVGFLGSRVKQLCQLHNKNDSKLKKKKSFEVSGVFSCQTTITINMCCFFVFFVMQNR